MGTNALPGRRGSADLKMPDDPGTKALFEFVGEALRK
jgi:hypothetical protein